MKKGILFSLGLMLLGLVILSLAILVFHNAQESEEIVSKLAVLDRVYDLDKSMGKSLSDIFYLRSGISINVTNEGVIFEETLPNNNRLILNSSLRRFKRFVESNLSNINLTITNMEEMPLVISPTASSSITYRHRNGWNDTEVVPVGVSVDGYSIFMASDQNVSCDWSNVVTGGSINLSLEFEGDVEDCLLRSEMVTSDEHEIRVNKYEDGTDLIRIALDGSNGRLLINLTEDIPVTTRTTIPVNQPYEVRADSLRINIDFGDFGVGKESGVRII